MDKKVMVIAEVAYKVNRAYCEALGDESLKPWEILPDDVKNSFAQGVEFRLANPDDPASAQHEKWMEKKLEEGWVEGEKLDREAKIHPLLVPFDQIPASLQAKDYIFMAVVQATSEAIPNNVEIKTQLFRERGTVGVRYVGKKESHYDNLYGTKLTWEPGQVHNVNPLAAAKMSAHPDVYEVVQAVEGESEGEEVTDEKNDNKPPTVPLPNFSTMKKADLALFAQQHYGEIFDSQKMTKAQMESAIMGFIGQRGRK